MAITELKENVQYYKIPNYTMKCRLYPNKTMAKAIDDAIYAIQKFYNCTLYEIMENHECTIEKSRKTKDGIEENDMVHFVDFKAVGSVAWKKKIMQEHPATRNCISSAITCKSGVISDMKKSFGTDYIEKAKVKGYSKKKPRNSYSYQETLSKITSEDNINTLYINLAKIGRVKIKGWNQIIRFGENHDQSFLEYAQTNPKQQITVTISKDNCGDYWICFKLADAYKPMQMLTGTTVGVDVGIKDIAICSDGTKYVNHKYKNQVKAHKKAINRRLNRRYGWSNEQFRKAFQYDKMIVPSKRYERTKVANAKLERKIAWKRNWYNHQVSTSIVSNNENIGIETLNVTGMFRNKHLANALSDAAMSSVLTMMRYKAEWYHRVLKAIDQWTPSSKRCSSCGEILEHLPLSVREWECPKCGTNHDRDINAAKNIRYYAFEQ